MVCLPIVAFASLYVDYTMEGWTIHAERTLVSSAQWVSVRNELANQLYRIARIVPDDRLSSLRKVAIWIHRDDPVTVCMAYHPSVEWLREHKANPEMARAVEIGNAANFISWTYEQPSMVLHELAHSYHDRILENGFENRTVKEAFDRAIKSNRYEDVLHWDGRHTRHYALQNPMEYFAESTEAYFGQNDFYPFVNAELKTFDPDTYRLMEQIWGIPQKR